jgi:hypothetical protein
MDIEGLLRDALRPIEPPEDLASRVESTLVSITQQASAALGSWADDLAENELDALRDPRNWVRPAGAVVVGGAAAVALVALGLRRRRRPSGLRAGVARVTETLSEIRR